MIKLNVNNETSRLRSVILGTAKSNGPTPTLDEAYDPKSLEHIKAGTYPIEGDMIKEIEFVAQVFEKYDVKVYRPKMIEDCNQIFSRDIGFVIDDIFIKANILPDREEELKAIQYVIDQISPEKVMHPPEEVHIEGGDVIVWNDYIFIGTYYEPDYADYIVARTNIEGVAYITKQFPHKTVKSFNLRKSQVNPKDNALHLDCCFQPIGNNKAILHKEGFLDVDEYEWLLNFFGKENCFIISKDEMYNMNSNVFSISESVIISEQNFTRLNAWLCDQGFVVEEVPYAEIAKQEGLLRCSTLPLVRD
ncbi:MAG: N-dimethylarginine dimethylaminohydrolase [Psychroserpens sp.]|jgi:N-dimethylarginine dimethylaminohydrolase|uniref:dimethylarginine dimethylaminohydrolase family protein n=1 Tax=Psychroserpens sp. TaxID=2020870 RepID=UPI0039E6054E